MPLPAIRNFDRPRAKRCVQVVVSLGLCWALYRAANWPDVVGALRQLDGLMLIAGLACFVPQTIVSAWRWRRLIRGTADLSLGDSLRHTLAASALNLVVPSKLGDFSKAGFVAVEAASDRRRLAIWIAVEKGADLAMLFVAMLAGTRYGWAAPLILIAGLFAARGRRVTGDRGQGTGDRGQTAVIRLLSPVSCLLSPVFRLLSPVGRRDRMLQVCLSATLILWTLHLVQIHCFLLAAGVPTTVDQTAVRVPAALLAGIVPAAFCGIGTRDAAFVWLYADTAPAATMAAVGMLTALRYLVPGAVGIPLLVGLRRSSPPASASEQSTSRRRPLPSFAASTSS